MQKYNNIEYLNCYFTGEYKEKSTELSNCKTIKICLMLLVLIYHSIIFWTGGWFIIEPTQKIRLLGILSFFLGESHIYAFVLVSGYIFAYSIDERGKYKKFGPFFKDKIKKLMVPYVFVLLVWVIPNACFFFHFDAAAILHRFLLGESPNQ